MTNEAWPAPAGVSSWATPEHVREVKKPARVRRRAMIKRRQWHCRDCGRPIFMAHTSTGKSRPVDAQRFVDDIVISDTQTEGKRLEIWGPAIHKCDVLTPFEEAIAARREVFERVMFGSSILETLGADATTADRVAFYNSDPDVLKIRERATIEAERAGIYFESPRGVGFIREIEPSAVHVEV